jgi:hypothetical protein
MCAIVLAATSAAALGYGPEGHRLVGAIADECLSRDGTGPRVCALLDGLTLEQAAGLPDNIKAWDRDTPDDPHTWHMQGHAELEKQLKAFWQANSAGGGPDPDKTNHNGYHYTDVPIATAGVKYADARHGTGKYDIVHMLPYAMNVLKGEIPEKNDRKITKTIALILVAHFVGDIHQPLHVGAQYFTMNGVADPDRVTAQGAQGGNLITLLLEKDDRGDRNDRGTKLHAYWDNDTVRAAKRIVRRELDDIPARRGSSSDYEVVLRLARTEPKGWKAGLDTKDFAEAWANEILPLAKQAHDRLDFTEIHLGGRGNGQTRIVAEEKSPQPDKDTYAEWAGKATREQIHKAGWRLAQLCRTAFPAPAPIKPAPAKPAIPAAAK